MNWSVDRPKIAKLAYFNLAPATQSRYLPSAPWHEPLSAPSRDHVFGTDELGRDVLSRTLFGARLSLTVAVGSAGAALLVAVPLGLLAGYLGGSVDILISQLRPAAPQAGQQDPEQPVDGFPVMRRPCVTWHELG